VNRHRHDSITTTTIATTSMMSRETIKELEERLKLKDGETDRLRRNIRLKDSELRQMQEQCNFKSDKVVELEKNYGIASSEVKQLKSIVESRFPDEVEQGLMEKTLLCAEASHQVDRLQEKLKTSKTENQKLREERKTMNKQNQALSQKLHKAITSYERLKQERNMNNKVFLELDDIVTALNNIRVESDFMVEDENDNVSMRNIRRKIQAIEDDRQRLAQDGKNLREENAFKDAKIQSLESKYYDPKKSFREPPPFRSRRTTIEMDDGSESSSDSSTIEPPPVSLEVYEETKREYESALRDMIKLTEELTATKASLKGYEQSSNETEDRFNELTEEYKDALLEMSNIRRDFQKVEANYKEALTSKEELKQDYETRLNEMTDANEFLEENYNKLKDDQNAKLVRLENEVSNSERFFEEKCKRLKEEHQLKNQTLTKDFDELKEEHERNIGKERRRYEDLRIEYETVRDRQKADTAELERLEDKYDKALKRIVHLEDSLRREKENNERALMRSSEEALMRYQKLKTDYNALLAAKKSAGNSESHYLRQLEGQYAALEEKFRHSQTDAEIRYKELQGSYESALATIDSLEKKLAGVEEQAKSLEKNQNRPKSKIEIAFNKISDLERELMSDKGLLAPVHFSTGDNSGDDAQLSIVDGVDPDSNETTNIVNQPLSVSSKHAALKKNQTISSLTIFLLLQDSGLQHFYDFLQHQQKLKIVHYDLLCRVTMAEEKSDTQSPPSCFFSSMFLDENLDIEDFKAESTAENSDGASKSAISKLLTQLAKIKLQAITARIRYQAREKELKLVFLRYKKVLEEYNSTIAKSSKSGDPQHSSITSSEPEIFKQEDSSTTSTDPLSNTEDDERVDPPGESTVDHQDETDTSDMPSKEALHDAQDEKAIAAKIAELEENLRAAEMKVEQVTVVIHGTKREAEEAEREQAKQESNLRTMLAKHKELEAEMMASTYHGNAATRENDQAPLSPETSFDGGSVVASSCASSISAEVRDEKTYSPNRQHKTTNHDTTTRYLKLKQEYDAAVHNSSTIEFELRQKKQETDITKNKLEAREEELKDVIQRYKELHLEYGGFLDGTSSVRFSQAKIIQERDAARWRISEMEIELRQAKESATTASAKQNLAKQHLRDVIFQYKTLEREHASLVQRIEGLRVGLPVTKAPSNMSKNYPRLAQIHEEEKRDFAMPNNTQYAGAAGDAHSQVSHQTGKFVDDTQSIASFTSSQSQSSKKKRFMKEIYREVKHNFKRKAANPKSKGKEVKQIHGL
jgi:chromosome segregation ATPase